MSVLISASDLALALDGSRPPIVLDVRWTIERPDGRPDYERAHVPGAVYVELETELSGHGQPTDGRHPLPTHDDLEWAARQWGIHRGDAVVVYDDVSGLAAARAWWLLRHAGLADVRILDGGLDAWRAAHLPLEEGTVVPLVGDVELEWDQLPTIDIDHALTQARHGVLLDARAPERYLGEVEPIDPVAGHIPGALNAPTTGNVGSDGRFLSADQLRARFEALGIDDGTSVAVYCGSGVTAAHQIAALHIAGLRAALYPGSWSQWSHHPNRPVATGDAQQEVLV